VTPDELARELAAGTLRTAYLLVGEEPLLREDALRALRAAVLGAASDAFDLERFEGARLPAGRLQDSVRTLPVLAPRRMVLLDEPESGRGGIADALPELIAELADGTQCVLVVCAAKADRRARWVKAIGAGVVECVAPTRAAEIAAFVRVEAERQGVALERGVAELLAERAGPQLMWLRQEIAKLSLLAGEARKVSRAHVAAGSIDASEASIWALNDAIGEGRPGDALSSLTRLLNAGTPAPVVLGSLASHFRRLLRVQAGASVPAPPFVQRKLNTQARRYSSGRLRGALDAIHDTDLALKGAGALRPERALERLVISLAG
jgi:DNA polymerase-3 subunit delta